MEDKKPIGYLFDTIAIYDQDSVKLFIENLTIQQATYVIIQSLEMANKRGIYNLNESELISKSLRMIEKTPTS